MTLEPRVDKLEQYMLTMSVSVNTLSEEMRDFKNEMLEFKNEMKEFKNEMLEFKNEMLEFKNEMLEFKNEMRESRNEMNIKWGNLANQLGKIVEDIIIPNIGILIAKYYDETLQDQYSSVYKRHRITNNGKQFDGIITTKSHIFLFEIKNQVNQEAVNQMKQFADTSEFFEYFPEYKGKKLIPVMGSINLKEHQVTMLTNAKILALAIKGDILTFKNFKEINKEIMR